VYSAGTLSNTGAYNGNMGLRPALNLLSSILVSDTVDSDGAYTITPNTAPTISGSDGNLGTFTANPPTQNYTVNDAEGGTVTVTEKIDGATINQFAASLGTARAFGLTADRWKKLLNGTHTLEVTANDWSLTATRTWTLTKTVTTSEFSSIVFPANAKPNRCLITIPITARSVPTGAELKIYACNNGNDVSPTWEDITNYALGGLVYTFTNSTKTASAWGVRVKVTSNRGTATSAVWYSAIGGAFD
jgi:hypothetical protein